MDFFKRRWSLGNSNSSSEVQMNQSQVSDGAYNNQTSVTFTNGDPNGQSPIIISTQHHRQISIIHEVRNPTLKVGEITSPTDSFHSVMSAPYPNDKRDGAVNMAYNGSSDMSHSHRQQNQSQQHPRNQVFLQNYWSWSWPWQTWNQREKIFLLIIVILSLCVLSLTSVLSVVMQKNLAYRDILFNRLGLSI